VTNYRNACHKTGQNQQTSLCYKYFYYSNLFCNNLACLPLQNTFGLV
jgi:hypothetical protein